MSNNIITLLAIIGANLALWWLYDIRSYLKPKTPEVVAVFKDYYVVEERVVERDCMKYLRGNDHYGYDIAGFSGLDKTDQDDQISWFSKDDSESPVGWAQYTVFDDLAAADRLYERANASSVEPLVARQMSLWVAHAPDRPRAIWMAKSGSAIRLQQARAVVLLPERYEEFADA